MYYKLNKPYALRKWLKTPYVLYNLDLNSLEALQENEFEMLANCDGLYNIKENDILRRFENKNIISKCEKGHCIDEIQKYKFYNNRYIRTVQWSLTGRCNYNCKHCFMAKGVAPETNEFTYGECLDIVKQLSECGIREVYLTGGEPLLRKDFLDIVDALLSENIRISIVSTNGALVNEELLNEFKKRNCDPCFIVSFDGVGYHDWMRGAAGAGEASIKALKLLNKMGFKTASETCLYKDNINTLYETAKLMNEVGVSYFKVFRTSESPRWVAQSGGKTISYEEYYDACLEFIPKFIKSGWNMSTRLCDCFESGPQGANYKIYDESYNENQVVCKKARNILFIAFDGRILMCNPFTGLTARDNNISNIKTNKLCEILTDSQYLNWVTSKVKDIFINDEKCKNCEWKSKCLGGCRAFAYQNGDFLGYDPFRCALFKCGYQDKIKKAADIALADLEN